MNHFIDYVARHTAKRPADNAVRDAHRSLSWSELEESSNRLAAGLSAAGVAPGDRVALLEMNSVEFAEITLATVKAGAILVPLNWRLAPAELEKTLRSAEPTLLLHGPGVAELGERIASLYPEAKALTLTGDEVAQWRATATPEGWSPAPRSDDTPVCIAYTSGSTGDPKGVVMAHSAFASVLPGVVEAEGIAESSTTLQVLPLFHIGGLAWFVSALIAGAASVMLPLALPKAILETIAKDRITHVCVVSTILQMMLDEQRNSPVDVSSVEMIQCGASPMPEAYLREAGVVFNCMIVTLYGLSEAGGLVCNQIITPADIEAGLGRRLLASGWAIDGVEVEIRSTEPPFAVLPAGEVGEIVTRSPGAMTGYWRQPELTSTVLTEDGWLHTGDLASVDEDGLLFVRGRVKDLIISGGENIYPAEVENVIAEFQGVAQVVVVGAPHPRWGESPVAIITPSPGAEVSPDTVIAWTRDKLATYKCPRHVMITDDIPLLGGGKVDRNSLRSRVETVFA